MRSTRFLRTFTLALSALLVLGLGAQAQSFPTGPIRLIVNFNPGGTTDLAARIIAEMAEERFGVPVVVENRAGAGGSLGVGSVSRSDPDGYTVGTITASPVTTLPYTQDMGFHPIDDLTYLVQFATTYHPIAVRADAPWETYEEFIAHAREYPGAVRYATAGTLNQPHLAMEQVAMAEDVVLTFVPFSEGGAAAMVALLGGHIDATVVSDYFGPLEAGQVRLLAETGDVPIVGHEDVPTFPELGYDFFGVALVGLVAPAGLPDDVAARLEEVFTDVVTDPEFQRRLADIGVQSTYKDGADFTAFARTAYENTGAVLQTLEAE